MDIEFIKWKIEYSEGFEYYKNTDIVKTPDGSMFALSRVYDSINADYETIWNTVYYPLLLQRAIEGVNQQSEDVTIYANNLCIWIRYKNSEYYEEKSFYFIDGVDRLGSELFDGTDQAKESALNHIYKQEAMN